MENSEIVGFQFEPTKAPKSDSSSGEIWETCSSADSEPNTPRRNEASVDTWCMCFNYSQMLTMKECLCYHELNSCNYFKIKGLYIYLLTNLHIFFIKLINEQT